jgi:CelD/BcsL family acetyltransferase involved in cellulose biosynthesis
MATPDVWHVKVFDRLDQLESAWRALEARGRCSLFQSYDWLSVWYEVTSRHGAAEPVVVTAARNEAAAIDVILPLCRVRRTGYWEICSPDVVSDFTGPLFAPEALAEHGQMRALWMQILGALPECDVVRLRAIPEQIGGYRNPLVELPDIQSYPCSAWGVPLAETAEAEPPAPIDRRMLKKTTRRRRQMEKAHMCRFSWQQCENRLPGLLEKLVEIRLQRFGELGRQEVLRDAVWLDFYRTIVARTHRAIEATVACLEADGETVAASLGFVHDGVFHDLLPARLGGNWNRYAPGFQLMLDTIRESTRRGLTYFDLTIGDEPYKRSMGAQRRPLFQIFVPMSGRGRLLHTMWRLKLLLERDHGREGQLAARDTLRHPLPS